jgi:hypothetical protein
MLRRTLFKGSETSMGCPERGPSTIYLSDSIAAVPRIIRNVGLGRLRLQFPLVGYLYLLGCSRLENMEKPQFENTLNSVALPAYGR